MKEWKERRTVVEKLRVKLKSMWQYQSHGSCREKLLTGAHRALIDCELCCGAQPITGAPGDFLALEHLHAVCHLIREPTQGGEWKRQKEVGEKKTDGRGGKVVSKRKKSETSDAFSFLTFKVVVKWRLLRRIYVVSFLSFAFPISLCLPVNCPVLNTDHCPHGRMLYAWPLKACHMASKGDWNAVTVPDIFKEKSQMGKSYWQENSGKSYRIQKKLPNALSWKWRNSSHRKCPDNILFTAYHKTNDNENRCEWGYIHDLICHVWLFVPLLWAFTLQLPHSLEQHTKHPHRCSLRQNEWTKSIMPLRKLWD